MIDFFDWDKIYSEEETNLWGLLYNWKLLYLGLKYKLELEMKVGYTSEEPMRYLIDLKILLVVELVVLASLNSLELFFEYFLIDLLPLFEYKNFAFVLVLLIAYLEI
jgi:hypothetical protein